MGTKDVGCGLNLHSTLGLETYADEGHVRGGSKRR